ncbi:hypothetical protein GO003_002160 [Methylicorpusculum oleiharenae]|uniref:hypothetical protein n=1 Tax=Methylicorpusculum oleiharenae TaxID=1338687 RepID=UPI001358107D|nr:hypothetical protein [Methylicorpusculum oleiharenae]MCD2449193.1 hypothetical protein [Methylicorpusculum oleiharenae]
MSESDNPLKADLKVHWILVWSAVLSLIVMLVVCEFYGDTWRQVMPEDQRVLIRTLFYVLVIIGFPLTNLLRHILLRLNQTMPGEKPAKQRYLLTVMMSLLFAETIAILGGVMYIIGDDDNTLTIFAVLAGLAVFLYRPKVDEYQSIIDALKENKVSK